MIFESTEQLLNMNGHGFYVWTSYAVAVLALVWLVAAPLLKKRRLLADIARRARRGAATSLDQENH